MKKFILFITIAFTFMNDQAFANDWYAGGTLHHDPISEWLKADPLNVLATTSDFVLPTIADDIIHSLTMDDFKEVSGELAACIYTDTVAPETYNLMGSAVLLTCMSKLKPKFPWLLTKTNNEIKHN